MNNVYVYLAVLHRAYFCYKIIGKKVVTASTGLLLRLQFTPS